ncbi:MAG: acetate--CoA ligase [Planctomycetes bacterium]|nr:acetate--CoA ligase [Planctomycetota bacterium]
MDYPPPPDFAKRARVPSFDEYRRLYEESVKDPDKFWARIAERITWRKKWTKVSDWNFTEPRIRWFEGGTLNVSENCLDRHVAKGLGDRTAIIWEGDDPARSEKLTYKQLLELTCRWANVLKDSGVKRGDRVCLYLPMIPALPAAMLACARIGAVHSVVFAGFSADSLKGRINDSQCTLLVTADEGVRGGKGVPLKEISDRALEGAPSIRRVLVVKRTGGAVKMKEGRDLWAEPLLAKAKAECPAEEMGAEDPLFILYTSGSTGKPKGVLHTTGGYLVYASYTHEIVFDWRPEDIYWCTADIGWVTGHSYIVYGPLSNGATSVMYEGVPNHPDWGRFWDVVDKHKVTIFYTAPTAIRAIAQHGNAPVKKRSRKSLRLLGTVGEPINPEAWRWYHAEVGDGRCPIVDTWWQTETGGILMSPLPGATTLKPGSATFPLPGCVPCLVDDQGKILEGNGVSGNLCIERPWPGMMRTVYGDHERFRKTYFSRFPGKYFTGDGCKRDEDGYYWITGRVDDIVIVSGHNLGTAEIESALVAHKAVAEAAVVGIPHDIKGNAIYAFVILKDGFEKSPALEKALVQQVKDTIGPIAAPERVQITPGLPKTRSGKIMRRILRKVAEGHTEDLGDTTTLADPSVVDALVKGR